MKMAPILIGSLVGFAAGDAALTLADRHPVNGGFSGMGPLQPIPLMALGAIFGGVAGAKGYSLLLIAASSAAVAVGARYAMMKGMRR